MEGGRETLLTLLLLTFLLSCAVRCEQVNQDIGKCKVGGVPDELLSSLSKQAQPNTPYYRYRAVLDCLQIELKLLRIRAYILYLDHSVSKEKKKENFQVMLKQAEHLLSVIKKQIQVVRKDKHLTREQQKHFQFLFHFLQADSQELVSEIKSFIQNLRPKHTMNRNGKTQKGEFENGFSEQKGGHKHILFHRWQQKLVSLYLDILNTFLDYLEIVIFTEEGKKQEWKLANSTMYKLGCLNHLLCKYYKQVYSLRFAFSEAEYKFLMDKFVQIQSNIRKILEYFHSRFPRQPLIVLEQFYQPKQRVLSLYGSFSPRFINKHKNS